MNTNISQQTAIEQNNEALHNCFVLKESNISYSFGINLTFELDNDTREKLLNIQGITRFCTLHGTGRYNFEMYIGKHFRSEQRKERIKKQITDILQQKADSLNAWQSHKKQFDELKTTINEKSQNETAPLGTDDDDFEFTADEIINELKYFVSQTQKDGHKIQFHKDGECLINYTDLNATPAIKAIIQELIYERDALGVFVEQKIVEFIKKAIKSIEQINETQKDSDEPLTCEPLPKEHIKEITQYIEVETDPAKEVKTKP